MTRLMIITLLFLLLSAATGCESIQFYQQAITGQGKLLLQRQDIEILLASEIDPALRRQLELAVDILAYAENFGLDSGGAYNSYVATGRSSVVWNVFAANPLELALKTSCFPVAGCVSYRGYFKEQDAQRYADKLREQGYDVYVGGVRAYSTLGWFDDPLLDTFLFKSEEQLAALLFHELAHQLVYVKGDTRFNESLATAVEQFVLKQYLHDRNRFDIFSRYLAGRERQSEVIRLINDVRGELRTVYTSEHPPSLKTKRKRAIFEDMVARYDTLAASWSEGSEESEGSEYRDWMHGPMNNAKLETVADYHEWVPVMLTQLDQLGFEGFVSWLRQVADLSSTERIDQLKALSSRPD